MSKDVVESTVMSKGVFSYFISEVDRTENEVKAQAANRVKEIKDCVDEIAKFEDKLEQIHKFCSVQISF